MTWLCITSVLLCHRAVRCPYLTRESQPGSLVSLELTCPLRPRYSLITHTHKPPPHYSRIWPSIKRCGQIHSRNFEFQERKSIWLSQKKKSTNCSLHFSSPHSGAHAAPQLVFCSGQRRLVCTEGHFSDWPLPSVRGGPRCVLVSPLPIPSGRTHHAQRAVRAPGPNRLGEGSCQSQQPSSSQPGGWGTVQ